jgi:hypothetical protein
MLWFKIGLKYNCTWQFHIDHHGNTQNEGVKKIHLSLGHTHCAHVYKRSNHGNEASLNLHWDYISAVWNIKGFLRHGNSSLELDTLIGCARNFLVCGVGQSTLPHAAARAPIRGLTLLCGPCPASWSLHWMHQQNEEHRSHQTQDHCKNL